MFRRVGAHCVARFSPEEVKVLRQVATEVVALLTDGFDREDPVVERLFPDVYRDDPSAAAELRRYIEGDLKTGKIDQAGAVLAALPGTGGTEVALDQESAEAWLRALNDVRLALGVRLGVTDEFDADSSGLDATDPRAAYIWIYHWLAYLQESLVDALS
jgi:hypothetical protein